MSKKEAKDEEFDIFDDDLFERAALTAPSMYFIEFDMECVSFSHLHRASFYLDIPNTTSYTNAHVSQVGFL